MTGLAAIRRFAALASVAAIVFLIGLGSSSERAFSQSSGEQRAYVPGHIFVKFEEGVPAETIARLERLADTRKEDEFSFIDVKVVGLPEGLSVSEAIEFYESSPYVEYAEPDHRAYPDQDSAEADSYEASPNDVVEAAPDDPAPDEPAPDPVIQTAAAEMAPLMPDDPEFPKLHGLHNTGESGGTSDADIDAPEAWSLTTGTPDTIVAVIDQEVDIGHPDLADNIWVNQDEIPGNDVDDDGNGYKDDTNGWDFANNNASVYDADGSFYGHGTHTAGIIAAEGNNSIGVAGVSWQAKIMPLKFMAPGGGSAEQAIAALKYAVANGADISNHSYRFGSYNQTFHEAIEWANTQGHLVVASAGNAAADTDVSPQYPAGYDSPNVVSVAATDNDDLLSPDSNRGATSVDLAAPGGEILSTAPGGAYAFNSGTSMAAPHVSGVAALLASDQPGLGHLQIKDHILLSAERKPNLADTSVTGGRLNAAEALGMRATEISLSATPTQLTYGGATTLSGTLASSGQPMAGKEVILEKRMGNETGFSPFATVTTSSNGAFTYGGSHPVKNTDYRARFGGEREKKLGSSAGSVARVDVRVAIGLSVATKNLQLGKARAIAGYVSPSHAGSTVELTITKRNSNFSIRKGLMLNANSRYSWNFKPKNAGIYEVSVRYAGDGDHFGDASPVKSFKVVN